MIRLRDVPDTNHGLSKLKFEKKFDSKFHPTASISGRRVDFGEVGKGEGLSWGIEVDIPISNNLIRSKIEGDFLEIPSHIKKITYLELAPQEALKPTDRTVSSSVKPVSIRGGSPLIKVATPSKLSIKIIERIQHSLGLLKLHDKSRAKILRNLISWVFDSSGKNINRLNRELEKSKGDTLVIVRGHSTDMSEIGEQGKDQLKDEFGRIIQKKSNDASIEEILARYNDPNKFATIILHGCNTNKMIKAKNVPVFYPMSDVKISKENPRFLWTKQPAFSIPE